MYKFVCDDRQYKSYKFINAKILNGEGVDIGLNPLEYKLFNQDIGNWNVGAVLDMSGMFYGAKSFNQELVDWCVSTLIIEPDLFSFDSALREENKPLWGTCPNN